MREESGRATPWEALNAIASGDRTFNFAWIIMKLSNMKHEVKMSKKQLIFRISVCWFVSERGKSTFLGLILFDFSCILFGQKCCVIFRPFEMKLRSLRPSAQCRSEEWERERAMPLRKNEQRGFLCGRVTLGERSGLGRVARSHSAVFSASRWKSAVFGELSQKVPTPEKWTCPLSPCLSLVSQGLRNAGIRASVSRCNIYFHKSRWPSN